MASRDAPCRFRISAAGSRSAPASAKNRCSVETYSSLNRPASSKARSMAAFIAGPRYCCETPATLGSRSSCASISRPSASARTPSRAISGGTTPSVCSSRAASRCSGSICCWSCRAAISCAACKASWAFTVSLSKRIISCLLRSFLRISVHARGRHAAGPLHPDLLAGSGHADLDLLGLGLFALRDGQCQHPVAVIGLDGVRIDAVAQREAAAEGAVRPLDPQVIVFRHSLLELAFAANGQNVVLHADVEVLLVNVREVSLHHQLVLGLVDVYGRRPGGEGRLVCPPAEQCVVQQAAHLFLESGESSKGFPTCDGSRVQPPRVYLSHMEHIICASYCQ